MFAQIFREDISEADLAKVGKKNPEQSQRMVRVRQESPARVPGTKPLHIFNPEPYLALRRGADEARAASGLLYHQAQHGMGWLPGGDLTGILGASLADFHPSQYITSVTPQLYPGAVLKAFKGAFMKRPLTQTAQKSAVGDGFLMLDGGMVNVGRNRVSKDTHHENGVLGTEPRTSTAVRRANVNTGTPYLKSTVAAPDASDVVGMVDNDEFNEIKHDKGFLAIFKMNPSHDKAGRFASRSGGGAWRPGGDLEAREGNKITHHVRMTKPGEYHVEAVQANEDKSYNTSLGKVGPSFTSEAEAKAHADKLNGGATEYGKITTEPGTTSTEKPAPKVPGNNINATASDTVSAKPGTTQFSPLQAKERQPGETDAQYNARRIAGEMQKDNPGMTDEQAKGAESKQFSKALSNAVGGKHKTISTDTPILPRAVAESAVEAVHGSPKNEAENAAWEKHVGSLVHRANESYRTDSEFAKNINRRGNAGRDFLHGWMKDQLKGTTLSGGKAPTEPVSMGTGWNGGVPPGDAAKGSTIPPKPAGPRPIHEIAREINRLWSKQGKGVNYAAKPYLEAMHSLGNIKEDYGQDSGKSVVLYFLSNAHSFKGPDAKRLKDELKSIAGIKKEDTDMFAHIFKSIGPIQHGAFHAWLGKSPDEPITDADIERGLKAGGHPAKMAEFAKAARGWHHGKKKD